MLNVCSMHIKQHTNLATIIAATPTSQGAQNQTEIKGTQAIPAPETPHTGHRPTAIQCRHVCMYVYMYARVRGVIL